MAADHIGWPTMAAGRGRRKARRDDERHRGPAARSVRRPGRPHQVLERHDLDQLSADLEALRDAIAVHEVAAFEWEAPDQAAARKLVGPTMWTLIHTFTTVRGRQARDGVVRWERAWLLAADRTLREQHWVINDEVVGPLPDDDR